MFPRGHATNGLITRNTRNRDGFLQLVTSKKSLEIGPKKNDAFQHAPTFLAIYTLYLRKPYTAEIEARTGRAKLFQLSLEQMLLWTALPNTTFRETFHTHLPTITHDYLKPWR